ncbi:MAG: Asp-tRNA(Asn)/Glu-tRNA(Gln) amidotransferase subunit GatA [Clostridiales bacterium]|nr:Asp-tRNA(Asn)/Glu-tRNA(Gln) amidotransferase subunit GatA [Clostridiales bacterium]
MADKQFSSREITEAYLRRIEEIDLIINAYITVAKEQALKAAVESDERRLRGQAKSKLDGIPLALKDNFCTNGVLTTCASKMLHNFIPPYSAACWEKLAEAGAVLLAKANMDEFAMGSSSETSAYGATRNPFAIEHVPGGSSGGSAAAVAADLAAFALGTDTGGGIRLAAHFCGVVGIKPTYGLVSRFGIVPLASSMDQAGVLAKSVGDAALVLEAIIGPDTRDANLVSSKRIAFTEACHKGVQGLKVGLPREFLRHVFEPQTVGMIERAAGILSQAGAQVEEVNLPHTKDALAAYYVLTAAEASSNMARYDGVNLGLRIEKENVYDMIAATRSAGFGEEAKVRILLGTYATSTGQIEAYYNRALRIRTLVKRDYDAVFAAGFDCLLAPMSPHTAFKLGELLDDPMAMYLTDFCATPINLAGLPALALPFTLSDGLPNGLQLIGCPFGEETLFAVAQALEQPRFIPPDIMEQARQKGVVCHD